MEQRPSKAPYLFLLFFILIVKGIFLFSSQALSESREIEIDEGPELSNAHRESREMHYKARHRLKHRELKASIPKESKSRLKSKRLRSEQMDITDETFHRPKLQNSSRDEFSRSFSRSEILEDRGHFKSETTLAYLNSAYRMKNEAFPTMAINFLWVPRYEHSCFHLNTCEFIFKIGGTKDLHPSGKSELNTLSFGTRLVTDPLSGLIQTSYLLNLHFPTTEKELHEDQMQVGVSTTLGLGTTPRLTGTDFYSVSSKVSLRYNANNDRSIEAVEWSSKQSLSVTMSLVRSVNLSFTGGHIWNQTQEGVPEDWIEWIQNVTWEANSNLSVFLEHNNGGPLFNEDGARLDTNLISEDNSVLAAGFVLKAHF